MYQWGKNFSKSNELFGALNKYINVKGLDKALVAFIHQHQGKNYFDQGLYELALSSFKSALKIRETLALSADQINSSKLAVSRSEELITTRK